MKQILLFTFIILINPFYGYTQSVNLVKDLNPGASDGIDQWDNQAIEFNGMLLLPGTNGSTGLELYSLQAGVLTIVKDINSGSGDSGPANFMLYNNKVYFTAYDATHGEEIWSTDGTSAGTMLAVEAIPGSNPSSGSGPGILIAGNNGKLYFSVAGDAYISDGTTLGTSKVAGLDYVDFNEDFSNASPRVTKYGNGIAFFSKPSSAEFNIYSLDASATPVLLKTVPVNQYGTTYIYGISEVSAGVLFALYNSAYTTYNGLFVINKSDGSISEIKDTPNTSIDVNRVLHFTSSKAIFKKTSGGIYSTDGTQAGTVKITPGTYILTQGEHIPNAVVNGQIVFYGDDGSFETKIYISDGTIAGTSLLATAQDHLSNFIISGNNVLWASGIDNGFNPDITIADVSKKTSSTAFSFTESSTASDAIVMMGVQDSKIYFSYTLKGDGREVYDLSNSAITTGILSSAGNTTSGYYKLCTLNSTNGEYAIASESSAETLLIAQYDLTGNLLHTANIKAGESFVLNTSAPMSVINVTGNNGSVSYKILRH